jgi:stage III sporulation protein AF
MLGVSDAIYGWMQNLAFFFIFMTAILNCLPVDQYRKYVQFFLGLVLMLVLCRPLLQLLNLDQSLSDTLSSLILEQEADNSRNSMFSVEGIQEEMLNQAYEQEIGSQIRTMLEEKGIGVERAEVQLSTGETMTVEQITLEVFNPESTIYLEEEEELNQEFDEKLEEVKSELAQVYQVEESHIDISRNPMK